MTCIMYCYVFTHLDQDEEKCTYVEEKKGQPFPLISHRLQPIVLPSVMQWYVS